MTRETFEAARRRLLAHLVSRGWLLKQSRIYHGGALKIPQVTKDGQTLYFRPQAVYLNAHSLWIDIRDMSEADFDSTVARWITANRVMSRGETSDGS